MEIKSEIVEGFHCILLKGRLDIAGTQAVDLRFTTLTSTKKEPVMVDLSEVDFIASIGIRLLASNAKTLQANGVKMVLVSPQKIVADSLHTTGIDQIIPIAESRLDAVTMLNTSVH